MTSSLLWANLLSIPSLYSCYIALFALFWRRRYFLAGLVFGICWITSHALYYQSWIESIHQKAHNSSIIGQVLAVQNNVYGQKITLEIHQLDGRSSWLWWRPKLVLYQSKLSDRSQIVLAGQTIDVGARLKPAFASLNPAGFNYARWLVSQSIIARGSVLSLRIAQAESSSRERWLGFLNQQLQGLEYGGEILALMVGDKRSLNHQHMQLYRQSGLSHLFVLSGLHLGIVALWSWYMANLLFLLMRRQERLWSLTLSLMCCGFYCWLANWQLPMLRALLMYSCVIISIGLFNRRRAWHGVLISLFIILTLWPFSMYGNSLWLSFAAVVVVLLALWCGPSHKLMMLVFIQLMVGIILMPLQVLMFGVIPSCALLVNLIAVPLFSVLLVPAVMALFVLYIVGLPLADWWADLLNDVFGLFHQSLMALNQWQLLSFHLPRFTIAMLLLFAAYVWAFGLFRRQVHLAWLSLLMFVPVWPSSLAPDDSWQIIVLDVGQGLSVVVIQQDEALIYDSGPRYRSGFSYAQSVTIPLLVDQSVNRLPWLVFSHGDNDHAGGRFVLEQHYPEAKRYYGRDPRLPEANCMGVHQWKKLRLQFWLAERGEGNNGSCVLRIDDGHYSLLLPGDIEQVIEVELLSQFTAPVTMLLSPHHGSNSSSSEAFVQQFKPEIVIHSSAAFNRFGFPKPQVTQRYAASQQFITGKVGAINIKIDDRSYQISSQRDKLFSPWYQKIISW
ncbi:MULTISPECIES: DNA internalization-related competence protein ComEC/Rec2 [unclassified Agarivorans]|uniref:DNA internalization-related competence protein ComEC/Rec2 n=1 Tax=unclassified Agarivorans TaxID=2636026 RepID=UPI003D7CDB8A